MVYSMYLDTGITHTKREPVNNYYKYKKTAINRALFLLGQFAMDESAQFVISDNDCADMTYVIKPLNGAPYVEGKE